MICFMKTTQYSVGDIIIIQAWKTVYPVTVTELMSNGDISVLEHGTKLDVIMRPHNEKYYKMVNITRTVQALSKL